MRGLKTKPEEGASAELPEPFTAWFASRGWRPHAHQLHLLDLAREGRDPTGGGKTLAGFLPAPPI
jgi:ATP-dependent Lhr-like helicase